MKQGGSPLLALAARRIVIFDGGLGTTLRNMGAPTDRPLELLVDEAPEIVAAAHDAFLAAGADVIETDTFGAAAHTLAVHGLEGRSFELNRKAAGIARSACDRHATRARPRFVAGSIGPGSSLPSLGQITFAELAASYRPQVKGLLAGGVDCLVVETGQDLGQLKAALAAIGEAGRTVPVIVSATLESSGRMLTGSDVAAGLAALEPFPVAAVGLNCGAGPEELAGAVSYLAGHSSKLLSVMPNAGMPRLVHGKAVYNLTPERFAAAMRGFATGQGLNIAGGCCGTGPEHIKALVQALDGVHPRRPAKQTARCSSLFRSQDLDVVPKPLICGERTNASGSKRFRELLLAHDHEGMAQAARDQEREGAHLVDLSVAAAGRSETEDMAHVCRLLNSGCNLPVMVDSTMPDVVEAALQRLAGRCIVNSASLADSERAERIIAMCRRYGAALVLMAIDTKGMAMTVERKLDIAHRLFELAVNKGGLAPNSLFFDFLTFTLGSGDPSLADSARETLAAVRAAKKHFPASLTLLGVSNVSHGLAPAARCALNSVFLQQAVRHGLDAAILHAGRILPLAKLSRAELGACNDLIFNRSRGNEQPLERFLRVFARQAAAPAEAARTGRAAAAKPDTAERLRQVIMEGQQSEAKTAVRELLRTTDALALVNRVLLPVMEEVGRRFERGEMQLPFVLRSAETVRTALDRLKPELSAKGQRGRGTIVLGTVRGDVHDIGKNLVDMILSSNGFQVVNIGVRQSPEDFIAAVHEYKPDAIGLSGLLVESARAMQEYVEAFARAGISIPVICGGAALNRRYVERDLQAAYPGRVYYARDAIAGLRIMQHIVSGTGAARPRRVVRRPRPVQQAKCETRPGRQRRRVRSLVRVELVPVARYTRLLDRDAVVGRRWRMAGEKATATERRRVLAKLTELVTRTRRAGLWQGKRVWGAFECRVKDNTLLVLHPSANAVLERFSISASFAKRLARHQGAGPFEVGLQLVTVGSRVTAESTRLGRRKQTLDQFLLHGLAAEMVEALAEYGSRRFARLLKRRAVRRFSPGYPVWPELSEQRKVSRLLGPGRIGVRLSSGFQMIPEYSTSAIIVPS